VGAHLPGSLTGGLVSGKRAEALHGADVGLWSRVDLDPEAIAFQNAVVEVPLAQGVASRTVLGNRQRLHRVPLAAAAGVSALPGRLEGVLIAVEIRIGKQVREVEEAVRCGLLVVLSFERLVGEPAQRRFARRTGGSR
jgi:hypothetical protein